MLHTKFRGPPVPVKKIFEVFYHIWAWWPSWLCDQHHIYIYMYLEVHIKNLVKNGPVVSEKSMF